MKLDQISETIERVRQSSEPRIEVINRGATSGVRLGVFASSFNPPTVAHVELLRRASEAFSLDETLALASQTNADKTSYECSLEDRVAMMELAFARDARTSIGLSSHAFYVDMADALRRVYSPQTDLHFIVGFDTFERVVDLEDRYTERYHRKPGGRKEALEYLFGRSSFIVAARAGIGLDNLKLLVEREPAVPRDRVLYLEFPPDLGELSSTEVRKRSGAGESITGLVPAAVEQFITLHGTYKAKKINAES
ncbi:MAG TPA: nicotinate-nicotinamide nucleotide adenylyltransferase [Blastocatellia bacterium]|nr:nicotinate-nicotinamide nucleotide adenylyltransferase [Blastocatellia bacterium]